MEQVRGSYPGDNGRLASMSLIEEGSTKKVRMANLAIVGSHSTNGVAAIHSKLLATHLVKDFATMFPERFNNKTNGVTPRRWLLVANPALASIVTEAIGANWISDFGQIAKIKPLADDPQFRKMFRAAKHAAKLRFIDWLALTTGMKVDPEGIFDTQIKRIHEYKRQLLNALHIVMLYNRLRANPSLEMPRRTFFFAGKAAPAYVLAKLIIKFINNIAVTIDNDPIARGRLQVVFLPDYNVSVAERLIPASDVSEQISTAGYEASGTSNMKLMMNGALTIGTRDGATIEMAEAAGEENFFLFGLTVEQVEHSRGWYNPYWHYQNDPEVRAALDLIFSGHFSHGEPGVFDPIHKTLLEKGDFYMHLADIRAYAEAQERIGQLHANTEEFTRKAILNVANSGTFSSDRTIAQYASEIWGVTPCPTV
jgi:glycogen phosphorylase